VLPEVDVLAASRAAEDEAIVLLEVGECLTGQPELGGCDGEGEEGFDAANGEVGGRDGGAVAEGLCMGQAGYHGSVASLQKDQERRTGGALLIVTAGRSVGRIAWDGEGASAQNQPIYVSRYGEQIRV